MMDFTQIYKQSKLRVFKSNYSGIRVVFQHSKKKNLIESTLTFRTKNKFRDAHCLEHMIFHGSKNHPYSLRSLSRFFYSDARGNIRSESTTYTLQSVNEEGFLNFLPIFLDYIFNPLLDESIFKLETHFIDGEGYDGGVVYCEDRGKQFIIPFREYYTPDDEGRPSKHHDFFPDYETVKRCHQDYYRMDNCVLTIKGNLNHEDVLEALNAFEKLNNLSKPTVKMPKLSYEFTHRENKVNIIPVPKLHNTSMFYLFWNLSKVTIREYYEISTITGYLSDWISEILREDKISRFCDAYLDVQYNSFVYGFVSSYITSDKIEQLLHQEPASLIEKIKKAFVNKPIDVEIIKTRMNKKWDREFDVFEESLIYQMFSQDNDEGSESEFFYKDVYSKIYDYEEDDWRGLIRKYFTEDYLMNIYRPDETINERFIERETKRVEKRRDNYGIDGLKKLQNEIDEAGRVNREFHDKTIDLSLFKDIKNSLSSCNNIKNDSSKTKTINSSPEENSLKIPITYSIDKSLTDTTARVKLTLNLRGLSKEYYPLYPIYQQLILENNDDIQKISRSHEVTFKANKMTFSIKLQHPGKASEWFKLLFFDFKPNKKTLEESIKKLFFATNPKNPITLIDEILRNLYFDPTLIERYPKTTSINYLRGLIEYLEEDESNFERLVEKMVDMHEAALKCNAQLKIHVNSFDLIEEINLGTWPELFHKNDENNSESSTRLNDPSGIIKKHINRKYCITIPEDHIAVMARHLHVNDHGGENDKEILMNVLSNYIYLIFFEHRNITGIYYTSKVSSEKIGLKYYIYGSSNLLKTKQLHAELIRDIVVNKKVDPVKFELAKRSILISSKNKSSVYNKIKDATPDDIIDSVGHYYLELFDDSKITEVILIPESMKRRISPDELDKYEKKELEDFMIDFPSDW